MSGLLAKLFFGVTAVGAPSLALFGGVIDWKEGVQEKLRGLDSWLAKAWENGGGTDTEANVKKLKESFSSNTNWEHPGLFVETVGDYMKRILNKDGGFGKDGQKTTFDVKGTKKIIEKVGFQFDKSSGGMKLVLETNDNKSQRKSKFLTDNKDLCILSITGREGRKVGKLDLLVGFYKGEWSGNTLIKADSGDSIMSGYGDWCQRRAEKFNSEKNLIIGIPFKSRGNGAAQAVRGADGKVSKLIYSVEDNGTAFIGKDLGNSEGYNRICGTKPNEGHCNGNVWPVVLAVIGNKKSEVSSFGTSSPTEEFSEIYWGSKTWNIAEKIDCNSTCNIGVPVGIKFNNVQITGKSLAEWSTNP